MNSAGLIMHPYVRLAFFFAGICGTLLSTNPVFLLVTYLIVIIPTIALNGQFRQHLKLLIIGILPILLSFILLYIFIFHDKSKSWDFIAVKVIKIILFTSLFQITLSIPSKILFITLKKWGFSGQPLVLVLSSLTVWEDVRYRANKIIDARFARGFVVQRSAITKARQLPYIILPLVIAVFRTAIERADSWEQKDMLYLVDHIRVEKVAYPVILNIVYFATSVCWLVIGLLIHFKYA
jgi:hypothetical protein